MKAKIISLMGVKDRVGASTCCFQLAEYLKKRGDRILLLDWNAHYCGELKTVCQEETSWCSINDLKSISKPFQAKEIQHLLKGPHGFSVLQLAENRSELMHQNPKEALSLLMGITDFYDWIIVDVGSRWNPYFVPLLAWTNLLLFILSAEISLVQEVKRKCNELIENYYPSKRLGWFSNGWNHDSYLTIEAVCQYVKIPSFGEKCEELGENLHQVSELNGDFQSFQPEMLLSMAALDGGSEKRLPSNHSQNRKVDPIVQETSLNESLLRSIQKKMEASELNKEGVENLKPKIIKIIKEVIDQHDSQIPTSTDRIHLTEELLDEILGLGPLETLLADSNITEILVNGCQNIVVEKNGKLKETKQSFSNEASLQKVIDRILVPVGRRIDEASPMVDARLPDGSRVNIVIPPLALDGAAISIRRFSDKALGPKDLIRLGAANDAILNFLEEGVKAKLNILVSGGTGSGKNNTP